MNSLMNRGNFVSLASFQGESLTYAAKGVSRIAEAGPIPVSFRGQPWRRHPEEDRAPTRREPRERLEDISNAFYSAMSALRVYASARKLSLLFQRRKWLILYRDAALLRETFNGRSSRTRASGMRSFRRRANGFGEIDSTKNLKFQTRFAYGTFNILFTRTWYYRRRIVRSNLFSIRHGIILC